LRQCQYRSNFFVVDSTLCSGYLGTPHEGNAILAKGAVRASNIKGVVCSHHRKSEDGIVSILASWRHSQDVPVSNKVPESLQWYAIRVQSRFEKVASTVLKTKGYEEFLPLFVERRRWSDRTKAVERPLFPGYLFCRFDVQSKWVPILSTPGVVEVVSAARHPLAVPDEEIEEVRAVLRSGLPVMPWPCITAGSRVLIEGGPLAGLEGVVLHSEKKFRLVISVTILQRAVSVEIDRDWIRPLAAKTERAIERERTAQRAS
jgi:transcription antitermination factor NusG